MRKKFNILKKKRVWISAVIIFLLLMAGLMSRRESSFVKYKEAQLLMGTIVQIDVCIEEYDEETLQGVYEKIWTRLEEIAWRMNVYDNESDVALINNSKAAPVMVRGDIYKIIEDSKRYSKETGGAFDITVWPLVALWKDAEQRGYLPTEEELSSILEITGMDNIQLLSDNRIIVRNGLSQIDLGGVAKGYAIDEAARILRENGITQFFIDAGGDVYVGGNNCQDQLWKIGIRDPRDNDKVIEVFQLSNRAVATSGDYERNYVINEKKWSHIFNPVTGWPQQDVVSATVVAPSAQEADAYATALSVMGEEKGGALINSLGEPYASLIIKQQSGKKVEKFSSKLLNTYLR